METGSTSETAVAAIARWCAPSNLLLNLTTGEYGIRKFSMDVCSPGADKSHVNATEHITTLEDSIYAAWHGTVWMNQPDADLGLWGHKLRDHGDGIALLRTGTNNRWVQNAIQDATIACFIRETVKYIDSRTGMRAQGGPRGGSVLLAYGTTAANAVFHSGLGVCLTPTSAN
ncbi:DNA N-6-adenine-methyltransferase [Frondihabitans australicus]|nr:DNA N-6-adenine-methyltransferase [Frondihabitans australicus]